MSAIAIRSSGLEFRDGDGDVISSVGWFDDLDVTLDLLEDAFGATPVEVPWVGHSESPPGTDYTWSGFTVRLVGHEASEPLSPNVSARSSVGAVGDVAITTANGLTVGTTLDDVIAAGPTESVDFEFEGVNWSWYHFDPQQVALGADGRPLITSVWLRLNRDTGVVTEIVAPQGNYGV